MQMLQLPPVCVDASFAGAMLLPEAATAQVTTHWNAWLDAERTLIVPPHFPAEVASAIRRAVVRGRISSAAGEQTLDTLVNDISPDLSTYTLTMTIWRRAWALAEALRCSNVYDSLYLAVAEEADAEFWTADANLVRSLEADGQPAAKWVHLIAP